MLSIEQIEAFITTVETGSFSAAARQLGKVQSAISQNIGNLEIDCGVSVFDRRGRYPVLTEAGHTLLPYAKAVMVQHNRLSEQVANLAQTKVHPIVLAVDEGIPLEQITPILQTLDTEFPTLKVECLLASSVDIIDMVQSGRATSGLLYGEHLIPFSLDFEHVCTIAFDIYVSSKHPLAQTRSPHIEMLSLHRQLVISARNSQASSFHQVLSPDVWHSDSYSMIIDWCIAGCGWTFAPSYLAKEALRQGQLVTVPLAFEKLSAVVNIDIIQHSSKSNDAAHKRLRELTRHLFKDS
ncbi:LysR family transcriptional regulator [Vibrio sp. 10N.286.49.C2]|uniref:LysR family transcriptional regulator n=1 Tax=unclassified Vibrio TaxID=2614977 RepID=UPI000C82F631|nr:MULTISPECIES: LysR family transcriptional regulator [unclassified Vibrio]PMH31437.1 LysR family transcriptional regulator [Vibrio sp. 10N.286.49.C2]PMH50458.1 LysR family transcriptional regulator [Vibrio sp. 10N.286.49.B1]PMH78059.1 LysR family transcriptional regulator [Vibrio sp. 10N.286.48.B7]